MLMSKHVNQSEQEAVALHPPCSPTICDWCRKNLIENTQVKLDTKFYANMCDCAAKCGVRGVIVLDGDKAKLQERIARLIANSENARAQTALARPTENTQSTEL